MAIVKACIAGNSIKNTGKECDVSMGATAMLIAVPASLEFDLADLADPVDWLTDLIHEDVGARVYPLFGQKAPIRTITNNQEGDVIVTLDDGVQIFLRYGIYNRIFETTSGGLCYAKALQGLNKSGYSLIEIDQQGQMLIRKNSNGSFGGLITDFMYSPAPIQANFKDTPWKNRFQISYSPVEIVQNAEVFAGASALLSMMGLIDAEITQEAAASTTKLKIGVKTECAETDLVALLGSAIGTHVDNFIVTNKATGAVVTPSAAAIVSGIIELTGTYVSAQTYNVIGSAPSLWLANSVDGYDGSLNGVDILIP